MLDKLTGLPIAHLNTRGLINKIDELIDKNKLKVMHISESFLTTNIDSNSLCIQNFSIVRRDRLHRHGGDVLTNVHSSLNHSLLSELDSILPESLSLRMNQPNSKPFITSVIYRPPISLSSWLDQFNRYISKCREISVMSLSLWEIST